MTKATAICRYVQRQCKNPCTWDTYICVPDMMCQARTSFISAIALLQGEHSAPFARLLFARYDVPGTYEFHIYNSIVTRGTLAALRASCSFSLCYIGQAKPVDNTHVNTEKPTASSHGVAAFVSKSFNAHRRGRRVSSGWTALQQMTEVLSETDRY